MICAITPFVRAAGADEVINDLSKYAKDNDRAESERVTPIQKMIATGITSSSSKMLTSGLGMDAHVS